MNFIFKESPTRFIPRIEKLYEAKESIPTKSNDHRSLSKSQLLLADNSTYTYTVDQFHNTQKNTKQGELRLFEEAKVCKF